MKNDDFNVFASIIGPKAENLDLFKELIEEALEDHAYWRRNFFPDDRPILRSFDKSKQSYQAFADHLRDKLFDFLSDAKKGVPFFSARYVGHMNADLLIPALVGYFSQMLYNQNNVAGESSPATVRMEQEVIEMLLKMVGFGHSQQHVGWGYLCSGGTTANLYSIWAARNLRTQPLALRLSCDLEPPARFLKEIESAFDSTESRRSNGASLVHEFEKVCDTMRELPFETAKGKKKALREMSAWELLNIPMRELYSFRTLTKQALQDALERGSDRAEIWVDELIKLRSIKHLGNHQFRRIARSLFPDGRSFLESPWLVISPANQHYSWKKAADIFSMGQGSIRPVDVNARFEVDVSVLEETLLEAVTSDRRSWPMLVVSNYGTTEEGALDDLPAINSLRTELAREHGATIWWHIDAAYGGYLASMARKSLDDPGIVDVGGYDRPGTLKHWLLECCASVGLADTEAKDLIELSEKGDPAWLSWESFLHRTRSLRHGDSITVDPHKLGYIPYPAGALLLKDRSAREAVSSDAPYLWGGGEEEADFTGRYTLEGSRPGAVAAGCWLSHSTLPLDQSGHGRLMALSVLATRRLYQALQRRINHPDSTVRVAMLHPPQSHILLYVPYQASADSLSRVEQLTEKVVEHLKPTNDERPFMAVETSVHLDTQDVALSGLEKHSLYRKLLSESDEPQVTIKAIRSVVMSPISLIAETRQGRDSSQHMFEAYAEHLRQVMLESSENLDIDLALEKAKTWTPDIKFMVMDDDARSVTKHLRSILAELRHKRIQKAWEECSSVDKAMKIIRESSVPLPMAFLDIDMTGTGGDFDSGFKVYEAILKRNQEVASKRYRVQSVVFFSKGHSDFSTRVGEMERVFKNAVPRRKFISKDSVSRGATEDERVRSVREIIREIAHIDLPAQSNV